MTQTERKTYLLKKRQDEGARLVFKQTSEKRNVTLTSDSGVEITLGKREFEVLKLICRYGLTNEQIAKEMKISPQTVKNNFYTLARKIYTQTNSTIPELNSGTLRTPIIALLVENGFLDYSPKIKSSPLTNK